MKNVLKKGLSAIILSMLFVLVAPSVMPNNTGMESVEAATVKLNATKVTLVKGQTKKLKIKGTSKKVQWSSNKKSVATVNKNGKVTAKKKGTAKITAKVGGKKYTCKITVEAPKISNKSLTLLVGDSQKLKISGTTQSVTWSSSKKSVASVTAKGKVKAKKSGTATITAEVGGQKYQCLVTVKPVGELSASSTSVSMKDTDTKKINLTLTGANAKNGSVSYSISDTSIVSCSFGSWSGDTVPLTITAENPGSTSIKITNTLSSKTCTIKVTVSSSITIKLPSTPLTYNRYLSSGALWNSCEVTNLYYTVERSGSQYRCKFYADGTKTYDKNGDNNSYGCYLYYKIYKSGSSVVVDSGAIISSSLVTGEVFEGVYSSSYLDPGDYELVFYEN